MVKRGGVWKTREMRRFCAFFFFLEINLVSSLMAARLTCYRHKIVSVGGYWPIIHSMHKRRPYVDPHKDTSCCTRVNG